MEDYGCTVYSVKLTQIIMNESFLFTIAYQLHYIEDVDA